MLKELLGFSKLTVFLFLIAVSLLFTYYVNHFFSSPEIFINTYGNQLSTDRIYEMLDKGKQYQYVGYIIVCVGFTLRILYNTFFLAIGNFFTEDRFRFRQFYNISVKAEIVSVLLIMCKIIFFEFIVRVETLDDINMIPFSLYQVFQHYTMPKWASQPLLYINIFELLYVLLFSYFLGLYNHKSLSKNLMQVTLSYGTGLLIWCLVLVYITLMFT